MVDQEQQSEFDELRKRQLQELQLMEVLKKILDAKAFERISNIRIANRNLYLQLAQLLVYAYQQGQFPGKVTEEQLIGLLQRLKSNEKESSITFKRK